VGDGAMIVEPHDPQNLAQAILTLLKDDDLRKNLSQRAIKHSQVFSWKKTAEETLELYLKVCKEYKEKIS
jgi:glycosyltransferase involved in cell wall biosynthesis